jgi:hypothetical protein
VTGLLHGYQLVLANKCRLHKGSWQSITFASRQLAASQCSQLPAALQLPVVHRPAEAVVGSLQVADLAMAAAVVLPLQLS